VTKETMAMGPNQLIAFLNALQYGDLDSIAAKLEEARSSCMSLGQTELAVKLQEAATALRSADVKTYRRYLETVVSRLGHLR